MEGLLRHELGIYPDAIQHKTLSISHVNLLIEAILLPDFYEMPL